MPALDDILAPGLDKAADDPFGAVLESRNDVAEDEDPEAGVLAGTGLPQGKPVPSGSAKAFDLPEPLLSGLHGTPVPSLPSAPLTFRKFGDVPVMRQAIFDNVLKAAQERYPIGNTRHQLELHNLRYAGPERWSLAEQKDAILKGRTLERKLVGEWRLINKVDGAVLDTKRGIVAHVPWATDRGTFIRGGSEYTVASQMRLNAGAYARRKENGELESHVNVKPGTGQSFRIHMEPETGIFRLGIGQSNLKLYPILRSMGVSDKDMAAHWGKELLAKNAAAEDPRAVARAFARMVATRADQEVGGDDGDAMKKLASVLDNIVIEKNRGDYKRFRDLNDPVLKDYPLEGVTYPTNYGYLPGYTGEDASDLDFFVGSGKEHGRFGVHRPDAPGGIETKFMTRVSPEERAAILKAFSPVLRGKMQQLTDAGLLQAMEPFMAKPAVKTAGVVVDHSKGEEWLLLRKSSGAVFGVPLDYSPTGPAGEMAAMSAQNAFGPRGGMLARGVAGAANLAVPGAGTAGLTVASNLPYLQARAAQAGQTAKAVAGVSGRAVGQAARTVGRGVSRAGQAVASPLAASLRRPGVRGVMPWLATAGLGALGLAKQSNAIADGQAGEPKTAPYGRDDHRRHPAALAADYGPPAGVRRGRRRKTGKDGDAEEMLQGVGALFETVKRADDEYGGEGGMETLEEPHEAISLPEGGRIGRDAFLYADPKPPDDRFAQCATCIMWTGPEHKTCLIHGKDREIDGDWSCNFYVHGQPSPEKAGEAEALVEPEESGLVERQVRCRNCAFFDPQAEDEPGEEGPHCELFEKLNRAYPDLFELDQQVQADGCCTAQTEKLDKEAAAQANVFFSERDLVLRFLEKVEAGQAVDV